MCCVCSDIVERHLSALGNSKAKDTSRQARRHLGVVQKLQQVIQPLEQRATETLKRLDPHAEKKELMAKLSRLDASELVDVIPDRFLSEIIYKAQQQQLYELRCGPKSRHM